MLDVRQSEPGYQALIKILEAYPQVSTEWLLFGRGEMLKGQQSETIGKEADAALQVEAGTLLKLAVTEIKLEEISKQLVDKDKQLADKDNQIVSKDKQLDAKDKLIDRLLTLNGIPEKLGKLMSSSPAALARFLAHLSRQGRVAEMAMS